MIELLGSTKSKINTDENCENAPPSEITEVVLAIVMLLKTIINATQGSCIHLCSK